MEIYSNRPNDREKTDRRNISEGYFRLAKTTGGKKSRRKPQVGALFFDNVSIYKCVYFCCRYKWQKMESLSAG